MRTAERTGIPAYVLDCASGDVYGIRNNGTAMKMTCDESTRRCVVSSLTGSDYDVLPIPRSFSQQEANERYQESQDQQKGKEVQSKRGTEAEKTDDDWEIDSQELSSEEEKMAPPNDFDEMSQEEEPVEDMPPPQTAPDAVGNTPEEVAVAWLKAYNSRDLERMKELSMPEFVEMWETGRDDFPNPAGNWRDAVIEITQTSADEATSSNPDWESIEIGVEFVCTGADSTTYEGGIAIYRYKSSGLYKVGFALIALPE